MPRKKKAALPDVERELQAALDTVVRRIEQEASLNAPVPSLARLTEILEKTVREREAEGLPPPAPDPWIDAAWAHAERAYIIAEKRAADRERAARGAIVVDRDAYPDPADYLAALVRADARAAERLAELRDRNVYLMALAEGPNEGR